jgi:ankyrin repeat protein
MQNRQLLAYQKWLKAQEFIFDETKDMEIRKAYLQRLGVNIQESIHGNTLLLSACRANNYKIVRFLLENGADCNIASTTKKVSPLHAAIELINLPLIKLLLAYGANPNHLCYDNNSPLYRLFIHISPKSLLMNEGKLTPTKIISYRDSDIRKIIELLIKHGADINIIHDNETEFNKNRTVLQIALTSNATNKNIKQLIDHGADIFIDKLLSTDKTILMLAAERNDPALIIYLVKKGLKIDYNDLIHATNELAELSLLTMLKLISTEEKCNFIGDTIINQIYFITNLIIAKKIKLDNPDEFLSIAAVYKNYPLMEFLLANGTDANYMYPDGLPPLITACTVPDNTTALKLLLTNHANINVSIDIPYENIVCKFTPIIVALQLGCIKNIKYLLENNPDISVTTEFQETILHLGAILGEMQFTQILNFIQMTHPSQLASLINRQTRNGETVLHIAAEQYPRSIKLWQKLLSLGADPSLTLADGVTTAHHLKERLLQPSQRLAKGKMTNKHAIKNFESTEKDCHTAIDTMHELMPTEPSTTTAQKPLAFLFNHYQDMQKAKKVFVQSKSPQLDASKSIERIIITASAITHSWLDGMLQSTMPGIKPLIKPARTTGEKSSQLGFIYLDKKALLEQKCTFDIYKDFAENSNKYAKDKFSAGFKFLKGCHNIKITYCHLNGTPIVGLENQEQRLIAEIKLPGQKQRADAICISGLGQPLYVICHYRRKHKKKVELAEKHLQSVCQRIYLPTTLHAFNLFTKAKSNSKAQQNMLASPLDPGAGQGSSVKPT